MKLVCLLMSNDHHHMILSRHATSVLMHKKPRRFPWDPVRNLIGERFVSG